MKDHEHMKPRVMWVDKVVNFTGLDKDEILGGNRKTEYARARTLLAWLLHRDGRTCAEIDRYLGTTHGSARYMLDRANAASKTNDRTLRTYMRCLEAHYNLN